jgi:hypothetical protein
MIFFPIRELHNRGSHRDTALLLQRHPVRCRVARGLTALDGTGQLNRAAEQQQFFRERGLTRIGVGDDRKGPTPFNFFQELGHGANSVS